MNLPQTGGCQCGAIRYAGHETAFRARQMKSYTGPPATPGSTAAAGAPIIVWCNDCRHQVEPDPREMAERYGIETRLRRTTQR